MSGIEQLDQRVGEPDGWDPIDIENLLRLRDITGMAGVESATLWLNNPGRKVDLRGPVLNNAAASIAELTVSIGSIRGHLNMYDGRKKRPALGLTDEATGRFVRITFPPEMRVDLIPHLEHDVVVWGELRRNAQGRVLSVAAEGIEELERGPAEPVRNLRGLFGPDWTGGLDTDSFVTIRREGSSPTAGLLLDRPPPTVAARPAAGNRSSAASAGSGGQVVPRPAPTALRRRGHGSSGRPRSAAPGDRRVRLRGARDGPSRL